MSDGSSAVVGVDIQGFNRPNNPQVRQNRALIRGLEISRLDIKKPSVEGRANLPDAPCVIATTHLSDIDVQEVAMEVGRDRKIGIASHASNLDNVFYKPLIAAMGRDNFFSVTNNTVSPDGKTSNSMHLDDLIKMGDGIIRDKRTIVIAGHNPTSDWKLANSPGMGAVILAHMANVSLVPAVLDIDSLTPVALTEDIKTRVKNFTTRSRPSARITFCEPMELAPISKEQIEQAMKLYSLEQRRSMTPEQINQANITLATLKRESEVMMQTLSNKLPMEKRGKWGINDYQTRSPITEEAAM